VSFAAITLCVASQRVFIIVDSVRKLLDTPSYFKVRHMKIIFKLLWCLHSVNNIEESEVIFIQCTNEVNLSLCFN
jgi:hypothetical protein